MNRPIACAMKTHVRTVVILAALAVLMAGCGIIASSHHDPMDYKAVDAAAEGGNLETLKSILARDPTLLQSKDWGDLTPLHLAVLHNHQDVVEYLLAQAPMSTPRPARALPRFTRQLRMGTRKSPNCCWRMGQISMLWTTRVGLQWPGRRSGAIPRLPRFCSSTAGTNRARPHAGAPLSKPEPRPRGHEWRGAQ